MKSPLRQAREKRSMTLHALATLVGSDVGNMSRIERGVQIPSSDLAAKICLQFDGELNELHLIYPERYPFVDAPPATRRATDALPPEAPDRPRRQLPDGKNVTSLTDQSATFEKQRP